MRSIILPVCWLLAAALLGFLPNLAPGARSEPQVYATTTVLLVCGLMALQTLLLMGVLRPATYARSWGRALLGFVVSFAFLVLAVMGSMHSPPAWGAFTLWTVVLFLFTFMLIWISALGAFRNRKR